MRNIKRTVINFRQREMTKIAEMTEITHFFSNTHQKLRFINAFRASFFPM